jgi:S-adenosylmethionine hydrolase
MSTLVTLTTDFGARDPSVAAIKGVLYQLCQHAVLVDLSHGLPRDDPMACALYVAGAIPHFPSGTIHLVDVNPGPTPVAVAVAGQYVVCPDNGILTVLQDRVPVEAIHAIALPEALEGGYWQVFFGREVFAPAVAHLADGKPVAELGEPIEELVRLSLPQPSLQPHHWIKGEVIHVDAFGNLITNIHKSMLDTVDVVRIGVETFWLDRLHTSYADVPVGSPLALYECAGYLQIAYRGDRADKRLRAGNGCPVKVVIR